VLTSADFMKSEVQITKKGRFLTNILMAVVFAPTVFLFRDGFLQFFLVELVCIAVVYAFVSNYPQLKRYKFKYFFSPLVGWFLGVVACINSSYYIGLAFLYAVVVLGLFYVFYYF
jgi:hypothetical protein